MGSSRWFYLILLARLAGFALQHDDLPWTTRAVRAFWRADRLPVAVAFGASIPHSVQNSANILAGGFAAGSDTWPCQNRSRRSR